MRGARLYRRYLMAAQDNEQRASGTRLANHLPDGAP
jgi:hypothetical protein